MPRTVEEILAHADELAARFEQYEPRLEDELNVDAITTLRAAVAKQPAAERHVIDAVRAARHVGMSWATLVAFVGTAGEAIRQRYRRLVA